MPERAIVIESPGLFTTVQDLGRPGLARFGVSGGGALDRQALILGNRLVGNPPSAAGLECTLSGPSLLFTDNVVIAVTGADLEPALDGAPIPRWTPVRASGGSRLTFAAAPRDGGARAYLCIGGGIDTPPVLHSRSTDLIGHFGGLEGRILHAGDRLMVGAAHHQADHTLRRRLAFDPPVYDSHGSVRVTLGPQDDRFTAAGLAMFQRETYRVTSKADRTGIRLHGAPIEHVTTADLISEGIAHGAMQVPGDGQPIILLAARQTVGGYVKIATAIGADLDRLGQLRPGSEVQLDAVPVAQARSLTLEALRRLGEASVVEARAPVQGYGEPRMSTPRSAGNGSWDPDGVIRIIAEAERAGVTHLRLDVASAGITLDLTRSAGGSARLAAETTPEADSPDQGEQTIKAPVLGTFYRRRSPDDPPLVETGHQVDAGALLGLIEVMKTYHEVCAPVAGTLSAILADDGHYVEYGQPLFRLHPEPSDHPAD